MKIVSFLVASFFCLFLFSFMEFTDDIEHINTTWLIFHGLTPYKDFFQNHHPLLWYLSVPMVAVFDYYNSALILYGMRFLTLFSFFISLYYLYKIVWDSKIPTSPLLLIFLATISPTFTRFLSFSPDPYMTLCAISGLYYFMRYVKEKKNHDLFLSFTLFFIGFLFHQKIILFLIPFGILILKLISDKKIKFLNVLRAGFPFILFYLLYLFYLVCNDNLKNYFEYTIKMNALINGFKFGRGVIQEPTVYLYIFLFAVSYFFVLLKKKFSVLIFINNLALLSVLFQFLLGVPFLYYLMLPFMLMTPSMGFFLQFLYEKITKKYFLRQFLFLFLLFVYLAMLFIHLSDSVLGGWKGMAGPTQYKMAQFVLDTVPKNELIFNGDINKIGLFHKNVHPFYHQLSLNGVKDKDLYWGASFDEIRELIKEKRPYLITNHWPPEEVLPVDFSNWQYFTLKLDEEILDLYEKEPVWGFYIRKK